MTALEQHLIGMPEHDDDAETIESPASLEQADWQLRRLARLRRLQAENEAVAHAEIQRIRVWLDEENRKLAQKASWIEEALTGYHAALLEQDPRRKTISLPAGSLKARKHPDRVDVVDADAFVAWAQEHRPDLVRTKVEPAKTEVKRLLSVGPEVEPGTFAMVDPATGEPAPGVVHVPGEISFTVDTPDLREVEL